MRLQLRNMLCMRAFKCLKGSECASHRFPFHKFVRSCFFYGLIFILFLSSPGFFFISSLLSTTLLGFNFYCTFSHSFAVLLFIFFIFFLLLAHHKFHVFILHAWNTQYILCVRESLFILDLFESAQTRE